MANDINNLQALYNKQFETLQDRLSKIDKQRSGMRDFYSKTEPDVTNQLTTGRVQGTFATPGYQSAFNNSLSNTQNLTDLNSEYATAEDAQFETLNALAKYLQAQQDTATKTKADQEKADKEEARYQSENNKVWNPETKSYDDVGGVNKDIDNSARLIIQGVGRINDVKMEDRGKVLQRMNELGFDPAKLEKGVIEEAEALFMGDKPNKLPILGTELAQGSKLAQFLGIGRKITKGLNIMKGAKENEYNDYIDSITATLRELTGEKGLLSDKDKEDLRKLLPRTSDSLKQAQDKFQRAKDLIDSRYNKSITDSKPDTEVDSDPLGIL